MTKGYLFDFDGTLVDTMEGFADIAGRVINEHHPELSFAQARRRYIETSGVPFCQQIEIIFPNHPMNARTVKHFEETKIEGFFEQKFSADVRYAIETLRSGGSLCGISSGNFPDLINEFVKREKLEFDIVMGFEQEKGFEKGKPHFDYFLKKFSLEKKDLTFVGDSLKDADKAYEYGIDFTGVCGLFTKEEFEARYRGIKTIKTLRELVIK
jgi:phosphoglycolate phosphatase